MQLLSWHPADYTHLSLIKLFTLHYIFSGFSPTRLPDCCSTLCGTDLSPGDFFAHYCVVAFCWPAFLCASGPSLTCQQVCSTNLPVYHSTPPTPATLCHSPHLHSACPCVLNPTVSHISPLHVSLPFCNKLSSFWPLLFCVLSVKEKCTRSLAAKCLTSYFWWTFAFTLYSHVIASLHMWPWYLWNRHFVSNGGTGQSTIWSIRQVKATVPKEQQSI